MQGHAPCKIFIYIYIHMWLRVCKGMLPVRYLYIYIYIHIYIYTYVVEGMQGHAPCKIFLLQLVLFLCQLKLVKIKTFYNIEVNLATPSFGGYCRIYNSGVWLSYIYIYIVNKIINYNTIFIIFYIFLYLLFI